MADHTNKPPGRERARGIDPWRALGVASLVLLTVYATVLVMAARQGLWIIDAHGALARSDFSEFWAAGRMALSGRAVEVYDWPSLRGFLNAHAAGAFAKGSLPFFYPPFLLLLLAPLMAAPPVVAAALWLGGSYVAYLFAVRSITSRPVVVLAAAAAPAAFLVVSFGQNGCLSAALLAGGLALLNRRPLLAGVLIGALAYKPQLGLLLPVVLIVTGRWRAILAAAATIGALSLASGLVFGWGVFAAFLAAAHVSPGHVPAIGLQSPAKLQSVYGLALTLGASTPLAWGLQLAAVSGAVAFNSVLWRSGAPYASKAAALSASVLLVTPYSGVYDLAVLVPGMAFLLAGSFRLGWAGALALLVAYLAPLEFAFAPFPVGPFAGGLILCVVAAQWRAFSTSPPGVDQF
jgi:hypothetical protein